MAKRFLILIITALILSSCADTKKPERQTIVLKDDLGNEITFDKAPQRIITLAPNLTEMIYDLGLGGKLVGNTLYCNYPDEARKVEKIGDMLTFNFEKILSLKPDLVLITVEGNTKQTYDKFRELGLKIFATNPRNFEGIKKSYEDFGKIFDIAAVTGKKIKMWDSVITQINTESKAFKEATAMFVVELKPVMLAGRNTFINQYLQICGLKNITEDSPANYPVFSREEILKRDPDYIIYPTGGNDNISKIKEAYPEWARLKAVKNNNVVFVNWDIYMRPGPRFAEAVSDLFNRLHPGVKQAPHHQQ
jgi:iron complex transport system substrate-binding protein